MSVQPSQRHTRRSRCPICGGGDGDPRGKEKRCCGFTSDDERWAHCSREELAGGIDQNDAGLYAHRLRGSCRCGVEHGPAEANPNIEATYDYQSEAGALLYQVVRFRGKAFRQRCPDGAGGWSWKLNGVRRVPYRLPQIASSPPVATVYLVEGERDVETLERAGCVATTTAQGAKSFRLSSSETAKALAGRHVAIIADADDPGRAYALEAYAALLPVAATVALWECPDPHKDVSDLFAAGGTLADLVAMRGAPEPFGEPEGFEGPDSEAGPDPVSRQDDAAGANSPDGPDSSLDDLLVPLTRAWLTEPLPERTWLLRDARTGRGVFPLGKCGQIIAEGGAGKTMALIQLAIAVATGGKWLDTFEIGHPGRVLLCLGEEDAEEARRRCYAAGRRTDPDSVPSGSVCILPLAGKSCEFLQRDPGGNPLKTPFLTAFRNTVVRSEWRLVLLDPLSRLAGPDAEKDSAVATRFVQVCESFVKPTTGLLCSHHTNKFSRGLGKGPITGDAGRGSSAFFDGFRWQCTLTPRLVEGESQATFGYGKSNYSAKWADLSLRREHGGPLVPLTAEELADLDCGDDKAAAKEKRAQASRERINKQRCDRLRAFLATNPGSTQNALSVVAGGDRKDLVGLLESIGAKCDDGPNNSKLWRLQ